MRRILPHASVRSGWALCSAVGQLECFGANFDPQSRGWLWQHHPITGTPSPGRGTSQVAFSFGDSDLGDAVKGMLVRHGVAWFLLPGADSDGGGVQRPQGDSEVEGGGPARAAGGHLYESDRRVPPQLPSRCVELVERGGPVLGQDSGDGAGVESAPVGGGTGSAGGCPKVRATRLSPSAVVRSGWGRRRASTWAVTASIDPSSAKTSQARGQLPQTAETVARTSLKNDWADTR